MKRFYWQGLPVLNKFIIRGCRCVLAFMIILTFFDVILRNLGHPITGSMEFIQYGGSIVFGFSIPYGTMLGLPGHCLMLVTAKLSPEKKR